MTNPYNPLIPFTSRKIEDLDPRFQVGLRQAIDMWNRDPRYPDVLITCTYRSPKQQELLFNQPRDGKDNNGNGIIDEKAERVTWTLNSKHTQYPAMAFDIAFKDDKGKLDWDPKWFKMFARTVGPLIPGLVWGGNWSTPDAPHFEI